MMSQDSPGRNEKANYLATNYVLKRNSTPYDFKLVAYILGLVGQKGEGTVLDLACGLGTFKPVFERFGLTYRGVDIDYEDEGQDVQNCDIGKSPLPFPDGGFDLVFFKMGIEYLTIPEVSHCLKEAKRVLKVGGKMVILTPDWWWTHRFFFEEYTHQTPFMESSLKTALQMAGFKCEYCRTFIQLPIVWRFPFVRVVCNMASVLYPVFRKKIMFIKFSQERPLLAIAAKE